MPAKMMSDMPLPMPRSVICSPSHMMKTVPVVSVRTVISRKPQPGMRHERQRRRRDLLLEAEGDAERLDEREQRPCRSACTA